MTENNLRRAMDTELSGLRLTQNDKWALMQSVLAADHAQPARRAPKIRTGLVLALIMTMLACAAVAAALLSVRQITDDYIIPMANDDADISYTMEETHFLVQLAEENGLVLSEITRDQIARAAQNGEGFYKDEMLKELAKAEFGENIKAWTLTQKHWWDEACTSIGWGASVENIMPEGGEEAKFPMIATAIAHIHAQADASAPLTDAAQYQTYVSYLDGDAADMDDAPYTGRYWTITFDPLYLEGAMYGVDMRDDGTVLNMSVRPGLSADLSVGEVMNLFEDLYGPHYYYTAELRTTKWTQEVFEDFRQAAVQCRGGQKSLLQMCMERTSFPEIPENAIPEEEAWELGLQALDCEAWTDADRCILIGREGHNPVWKFQLTVTGAEGKWENWAIEMDCITGEVLTTRLVHYEGRRGPLTYSSFEADTTLCEVFDPLLEEYNAWYEQWVEENSVG